MPISASVFARLRLSGTSYAIWLARPCSRYIHPALADKPGSPPEFLEVSGR
jgi:hypothetical protein